MGELEPLLDGFDICSGVFSGERGIDIQVEIWRKHWFPECRNHGGGESVRFMRHSIEGLHDFWDLVNLCLGGGSFKQTSSEHIIKSPVAPLVDCIALRMIRRSENQLDPQRAQQLGPDVADEFPATVREEPARGTKVGDHMAHEGFADCVGGVVVGRDEDGVFRVAIHKHNQEFLAVVWGQRSYNVNGQRIPGTLRLDSTIRLLAISVVAAQLTLGTTLRGFKADAVFGFVRIPVAEELPQRLST